MSWGAPDKRCDPDQSCRMAARCAPVSFWTSSRLPWCYLGRAHCAPSKKGEAKLAGFCRCRWCKTWTAVLRGLTCLCQSMAFRPGKAVANLSLGLAVPALVAGPPHPPSHTFSNGKGLGPCGGCGFSLPNGGEVRGCFSGILIVTCVNHGSGYTKGYESPVTAPSGLIPGREQPSSIDHIRSLLSVRQAT